MSQKRRDTFRRCSQSQLSSSPKLLSWRRGVAVVEPDRGVLDYPFLVTPSLCKNKSRSVMSNRLEILFTKFMWRIVWIGSGMEDDKCTGHCRTWRESFR